MSKKVTITIRAEIDDDFKISIKSVLRRSSEPDDFICLRIIDETVSFLRETNIEAIKQLNQRLPREIIYWLKNNYIDKE